MLAYDRLDVGQSVHDHDHDHELDAFALRSDRRWTRIQNRLCYNAASRDPNVHRGSE